jgi:hypothetical protein
MGAHIRHATSPPIGSTGPLRICSWIRSTKVVLRELKSLIELLVLIAVSVWGFWHVLQVLFLQVK